MQCTLIFDGAAMNSDQEFRCRHDGDGTAIEQRTAQFVLAQQELQRRHGSADAPHRVIGQHLRVVRRAHRNRVTRANPPARSVRRRNASL